jgi:ABC-type transport system involved in multi-copper enzyme maturation permease subunit
MQPSDPSASGHAETFPARKQRFANLKFAWHWWRTLRHNPIYLRERGGWGRPNPFYDNISRFSPFIALGALILGACTVFNNPSLLAGDQELLILWGLLCLPGMALTVLTLIGVFMAPALTAPSISYELDRGTWDMLRLTPQPVQFILLAKLLGALSRLRIWPLMFLISLLQGLVLICGVTLTNNYYSGLLLGFSALSRPWLEVLFAAFLGLYLSTWIRSATMALAATYAGIVLVKVANSFLVWLAVLSILDSLGVTSRNYGYGLSAAVGPTLVYFGATAVLCGGLFQRAERIGQ